MTETRSLPLPDGLDGLRLDVALARLLGLSRAAAAALVEAGSVTVDGAEPVKSQRVSGGAWVEVTLPETRTAAEPQPVPGLAVVYRDDDILVVDKPPGVAAHPSPGWDGPTVTGGLQAAGYRLASSGAAEREGVVHRLDVGTSGLMVVATSELAYSVLKTAFRERSVDKHYTALVQGHPDPSIGTIDAPIDRHPTHEYKWAVVSGGRPSVTHYETLEAFPAASRVGVALETGRTHQIRVHMSAVRHPCVGDLLYGADPTLAERLGLTRQWLHATRLRFAHPRSGEPMSFDSAYPADLQHALDVLAASS
jgi:23S rRNA pseudouridine1911/1915/1917 synthase